MVHQVKEEADVCLGAGDTASEERTLFFLIVGGKCERFLKNQEQTLEQRTTRVAACEVEYGLFFTKQEVVTHFFSSFLFFPKFNSFSKHRMLVIPFPIVKQRGCRQLDFPMSERYELLVQHGKRRYDGFVQDKV